MGQEQSPNEYIRLEMLKVCLAETGSNGTKDCYYASIFRLLTSKVTFGSAELFFYLKGYENAKNLS